MQAVSALDSVKRSVLMQNRCSLRFHYITFNTALIDSVRFPSFPVIVNVS
jgi:hypothetical protein